MSRIQQDQFVDDEEEEVCPLCVEEFDLSDKSFRPCPCGYQICQFCFNNIKTTMNGLCPACRRPYDESTIQFKAATPEEIAKARQQQAQKAKKNQAARQKEAQKAEADSLSRKHLAGLRVVQKNLVYVTGLTPTIREDRLLETLRGSDYFGQYGKIIKIVVSKAKENAQHQQSVGVYVTFARKEDAAACIAAVDGSQNGERTLRAQYGTTKYCSAYLRNEQCNNRNCMFLHEPGEENDSFTRQDLSLMNVIGTQQPTQSLSPQPQPPPQRAPQNIAAAAAPMHRQDSTDALSSPTHSNGDGPALPATANWGSKATQGRRASRSTNASNPSPMTTNAVPVAQAFESNDADEEPKKKGKEKGSTQNSAQPSASATPHPTTSLPQRTRKPQVPYLDGLLKAISNPEFKFIFSATTFSPEDLESIVQFPQFIDPNGGAKRRALKEKKEQQEQGRETDAQPTMDAAQTVDPEDNTDDLRGSLQLGGEPEERHDLGHGQQHAIAPPSQNTFGGSLFSQNNSLSDDFSNLGLRGNSLTAQQQQQLLLFKSGNPQNASSMGAFQGNQNQPSSNAQQTGNAPGHARHTSRFSFANESSASAAVQPVANQKLMSQQSSMMPKAGNHFNQLSQHQISQHQPLGNPFYTSGVQGPPPGLKATGTPPVSGGGMFGQGHGFATGGLGYGANAATRNNNDAMYQELLRNRGMDGGPRAGDAGKHEQEFAPSEQASLSVDALVNDFDTDSGVVPTTVAQHMLEQPRRATPTIPPGFSAPGTPRLLPEQPVRPLSRTGITPAVPVIPATPIRAATPVKPPNKERRLADPPVEQHENDIGMEKARLDRLEPIETSRETQATPSRVAKDVTSVMTTTSSKASRKKVEPASTTHKDLKNPKVNVADDSQSHVKATSKIKRPVLDASPNKRISSTSVAVTEIQKDVRGTAVTHIGSSKRQPPGKLDIAAATQLSADEPADSGIGTSKGDVYPKNLRTVSLASESQPASPATTATGSPVKRSAPRTIRVLPTPKTENPPPLSANSMASLPQVPTVDKLRSRQASIASVNQPVTPISELTDNASVTSASMSRANSPPPGGKVGSAPVRKKTKAQAKKERQERARQIAEEQALTLEDSVKSSDPEPVQAPIVGRKKKTKKPTTTSTTAISSVAQSLPSSPPATISGKAAEDESSELKDVTVSEVKQQAPTSKKASSTKPSVSSPRKASQPSPTPSEEPKQEKGEPTAASILADLQRTGELLASTLEFFKPLSSTLSHVSRSTPATSPPADPNALPSPPDLKIHFSEADLDALAKKKPVRLGGGGGKNNSRTLITPQGKFLWSLTQELEEKVLDLEKSIEECKGAARWRPRQQAHGHGRSGSTHGQSSNYGADVLPAIATALKEAGANLGKSPQASTQGTSTSKLVPSAKTSSGTPSQQSIDDALVYLNQWVLPPSDSQHPNAPRPESFSVGGHPGSAKDAHASAHNLAAAAKAVAEGRVPASAIPMQDLENLGVYAAEVLGGYVVQGLEALVGAGLGVESGMGAYGSESLGMSGGSGRERGKLLSVEEAEQAMIMARKETEQLEKKVNALMKRNGRFVKGSVGGR